VTHLVLAPGPQLNRSAVIPITLVEAVTADGILVKGTREELTNLGFYTPRSDAEIGRDVGECLVEAGCDPAKVSAAVDHGVVTLTGQVPDTATQRRAETNVRRLEGVVDVENMLGLDSALAGAVSSSIAIDPRTLTQAVDVSVWNGVATLTGVVATEEEKVAAEDVARGTEGVDLVINELVVDRNIDRVHRREGVFVLHPAEWRGRGNWANWPGY